MDEIVIESRRENKYTVKSILKVPNRIKKYVKTTSLFLIYDKEVTDNNSILNIPMVSIVLPLAWLTDTDIRVDELDKKYIESMTLLKREINKIFPGKQFKTNIHAGRPTENRVNTVGTSLLFSGGVDSTYSLINNWDKTPSLIMIWGVDAHPYPEYSSHWKDLEAIYSSFALRNGLDFSMIKTNASQILNNRRLEHDFHEVLYGGWIRMKLQHTLILLPLAAPLSIGRFNEIIIAASADPSFGFKEWPVCSLPWTDEKIVWADLVTKHDGVIPRIEKTKTICDFMKKHEITLKVCSKPILNCSSGGKCYRTIMPLVLLGTDPNDCGFKVDKTTFKEMWDFFRRSKLQSVDIDYYLKKIQAIIPDKIENDMFESKAFFQWFREVDLDKKVDSRWLPRQIYNKLPYPIAVIYDYFISKTRINIHPAHYHTSHYSDCARKAVSI